MKMKYLVRVAIIFFLGLVTGSVLYSALAGGEQGWGIVFQRLAIEAWVLVTFLSLAFMLRPKEIGENAFYVGLRPHSFRFGQPAEIIGVKMVAPQGLNPRPCFHLRFEDGMEDFSPIHEVSSYQIISKEEDVSGENS